jgi:protein TonB
MGHVAIASPHTQHDTRFVSLGWKPESHAGRRGATLTVSIVVHVVLIAACLIVPLVYDDIIPEPADAVRAFFVEPAAPPPPPPPPPPPAPAVRQAVTRPPQPVQEAKFVAPIEVPQELPEPDQNLDSFGIEGGVAGGVEGGVPGGVVGGVVGGLPTAPAEPPRVRVGGSIIAPKLLKKVAPPYPELARASRVGGIVILEAVVGTNGHVKSVSVLRGHPLLDPGSIEAVKQWRYQPLLLNGVPTEFVLTVTLAYNISTGGAS